MSLTSSTHIVGDLDVFCRRWSHFSLHTSLLGIEVYEEIGYGRHRDFYGRDRLGVLYPHISKLLAPALNDPDVLTSVKASKGIPVKDFMALPNLLLSSFFFLIDLHFWR